MELIKFFIVSTRFKTDNTAEYGFGDYSERVPFINLIVEAETKRKAMNKAKKIDNRLGFSGMFGDQIYSEVEIQQDELLADYIGERSGN